MKRQLGWKRWSCWMLGGALLLPSVPAVAVDWVGDTGPFMTDANWAGNSIPDVVDEALINNGGTATLADGDDAIVLTLRAGLGAGSGNFQMSGGTFQANGAFIGDTGGGTAVISGGEFAIGGDSIHVGFSPGGVGSMTISGASTIVTSGDDFQLGREGTGTLDFSGGTLRAGYTVVGKFGSGLWNQTGGMFDQDFGDLEIGDGGRDDQASTPGPRNGVINFSGGFMQIADNVAIGNRRGNGTVNISGGVLAVTGNGNSSIIVGRGNDTTPRLGGNNSLRVTGGDAMIVANGGLLMDPNDAVQSATLIAEITGKDHTTIYVGGDADISSGNLSVELSGYSPVANDSWVLIQAGVEVDPFLEAIDGLVEQAGYEPLTHAFPENLGTVLGPFANVDFSGAPLGPGLAWEISYAGDAVTISVVGGGVPGDFDGNGLLDAADINLLSAAARSGNNDLAFDLNSDSAVNAADRDVWVNDLKNTFMGDSNLDGEFNSSDFVLVFTSGQYEDGVAGNSAWETGDWNGDTEFDSSDFVTAFTAGGFELGPRAAVAAVPEPTSLTLLFGAAASILAFVRRRRNA